MILVVKTTKTLDRVINIFKIIHNVPYQSYSHTEYREG